MDRLLVLGGGGRIGRMLRQCWPARSNSRVTWHGARDGGPSFDILRDQCALREAFETCDHALILAGATPRSRNWSVEINQQIAQNCLQAALGKPLLFVSTAAVYGDQPAILTEQSATAPITRYGQSKLDAEHLLEDSPNAKIVRLGNVAGADALLDQKQGVVHLDQFRDGSYPIRSYIGPIQLSDIISRIVTRIPELPKRMNLACSNPVVLDQLLTCAGREWRPRKAKADVIRSVVLDTGRLGEFCDTQGNCKTIAQDYQRWYQNR